MARPRSTRPTDVELKILKVLWEQGPSTVREVMETLSRQRRVGYTSVLKMLQIMTEKGLVVRDERHRAHVYRSREKQHAVVGKLVGDMVDRVFDGSGRQLVLHILEQKRATPEELAEIRALIDRSRGRGK